MRRSSQLQAAAVAAMAMLGACGFGACGQASAADGDAGAAAAVIESFHGALLAAMKSGAAAGCAARAKGLAPTVDKDFDMAYLAQRVLRRRWTTLNDEQRKQFTEVFRELVLTTYAGNFSKFNGEKFSAPDAQALPDGTQFVKTQLITSKGESVELDYVLHSGGGNWQVVNIIAEGVSNLALWSAQYDRVFQDQGYDGLMKQLRAQVAKAKADC